MHRKELRTTTIENYQIVLTGESLTLSRPDEKSALHIDGYQNIARLADFLHEYLSHTPSPKYRPFLSSLLIQIGIPQHLGGFYYLQTAVRLILENPGVPKSIYNETASQHGTTQSVIERGIRHAIQRVFQDGNQELTGRIFGNKHPTNVEFIHGLANYIITEVGEL